MKIIYILKLLSLTIVLIFPFLLSTNDLTNLTSLQKDLLESLPPDPRDSILLKMDKANELEVEIEEAIEQEKLLIERPGLEILEKELDYCDECIYGYNFFRFSPSTFSPANKIPASQSYVLGPGDKLDIRIYGSENTKIKDEINSDGLINLTKLGQIFLSVLSYK